VTFLINSVDPGEQSCPHCEHPSHLKAHRRAFLTLTRTEGNNDGQLHRCR